MNEKMRDLAGRRAYLQDKLKGILDGIDDWTTIDSKQREQIDEINRELEDIIAAYDVASKAYAAANRQPEPPVEEPVVRPPAGDPPAKNPQPGDAGALFIASDGYKAALAGRKGIEVEIPYAAFEPTVGRTMAKGYPYVGMKATLGTDSTATDVDTQFAPEVLRTGVVVDTLFQEPNVLDLIPQMATSQNAIKYMEETVTSTGAAETAEGAAAPEANLSFTEKTADIKKIAVLLPVTEELLADEPTLRAYINGRLRLFVRLREDLQVLKGDGTGENITGIVNTAGIGNVNISLTGITAQAYLEAVHNAIRAARQAFIPADAVVMNSATWEFLRLAKDANSNYLLGPAGAAGEPRVWGLPVVVTENMDDYNVATNIGTLVGGFRLGAEIRRRQQVTVAVSDSHSDFFARGKLALKATSRLGLAVLRPAAFVTVTSTA